MDQQDNDKLYRYLFQQRAVRGEWVRLNQSFIDTLNTHKYPTVVRDLLGEMLVATSLLTATLKFSGQISMQIQGNGPLKLALVDGSSQQQMRAVARIKGEISNKMSLQQLVGKRGVLGITIEPDVGRRYQGIVSLDKPTISECLEDYFMRSEQLPTKLIIRTGKHNKLPVAAGMLLQIMPDGTGTADDFEHLTTLAETVTEEELFELSAEQLLYRLYHQETVEIYPVQTVSFHCGCSAERSGAALLLMRNQEINYLLMKHQGNIDIQCECCGTHYFFNKEKIQQLKDSHGQF